MNVIRGVRRTAVVVIVASLVVAAGLGIAALLSGEFGDTQAKVLLTTLTVAAFGTTALCHLAVVARAVRVVGFAGIAASAGAAAVALVLVWGEIGDSAAEEALLKSLVVLAIAAVSLAQANLLLLLAGRRHLAIRVALGVTLAAIAAVAVLVVLPILTDGDIPGEHGDGYWRAFGVVAILDALGTIALPVLGLVLRRPPSDGAVGDRDAALRIELPADVAARLASAASDAGMTPGELATRLVRDGLDGSGLGGAIR